MRRQTGRERPAASARKLEAYGDAFLAVIRTFWG